MIEQLMAAWYQRNLGITKRQFLSLTDEERIELATWNLYEIRELEPYWIDVTTVADTRRRRYNTVTGETRLGENFR